MVTAMDPGWTARWLVMLIGKVGNTAALRDDKERTRIDYSCCVRQNTAPKDDPQLLESVKMLLHLGFCLCDQG